MPVTTLDYGPQCRIYTLLEHLQGKWIHHLPRQPILMLNHSF